MYTVTSVAHSPDKELKVMRYVHKNINRTRGTNVLEQSATISRHGIEVYYGVATAQVFHEHRFIYLDVVFSPTKIFLNVAKLVSNIVRHA